MIPLSPATEIHRSFHRPIQGALGSYVSISSKRRPDRTSLTRPRRAFPSDSFPIVGIGASAGGLEAFSRLLARLPPNTGMAFIFVQHLTRDHASLLTELLSKTTPMTVTEARHGVLVKPDNVYVIPPNTGLVISQRTIHLHRRLPPPAVAWPIDDFFSPEMPPMARSA